MSNSTITSSTPPTSESSSFSSFISASSSAQESFSSSVASSVSSEVIGDSTTTVEPSTTSVVTSIVSASSAAPQSTVLFTSVITQTPTASGQTSLDPVTVVVTSISTPSTTAAAESSTTSTSSSATSTASNGSSLSSTNDGSNNSSSGLSEGSKTAVAVVVPVVVVALLVLAGLFFWRKRKQRKNEAEARRNEVEEYGYNPNNDPTLPVIGQDGSSEMAEDHSTGYRGWGNTTMSNRKASTTLSNGHTAGQLSDAGSNPGGVPSPGSPTNVSEGNSGEGLMDNRRETMGSDDLGALGAAPVAGSHRNNNDIRRGPSNASSSYSAGNRSDHSDPSIGNVGQAYSSPDMYQSGSYGYNQHGPYGDGTYGGGMDNGMPIVRDVSARRNTRIEAGGSYQQGNSGIAQNF